MIVLAILILAVAAGGFYCQDRSHRVTINDTIGHYESALAWERTRVDNLLVQVQANSQGFQHVPSFGPLPDPEEPTLVDDFGFDTGQFASDDERDFVPAANL